MHKVHLADCLMILFQAYFAPALPHLFRRKTEDSVLGAYPLAFASLEASGELGVVLSVGAVGKGAYGRFVALDDEGDAAFVVVACSCIVLAGRNHRHLFDWRLALAFVCALADYLTEM